MKITPTHLPSTLLPLQDGLQVEALDADDQALTVILTASASEARCPLCATPTTRVHSHYCRRRRSLLADGGVYIAGQTHSTDFATSSGAYPATLAGGTDAFVTKLVAATGAINYST